MTIDHLLNVETIVTFSAPVSTAIVVIIVLDCLLNEGLVMFLVMNFCGIDGMTNLAFWLVLGLRGDHGIPNSTFLARNLGWVRYFITG